MSRTVGDEFGPNTEVVRRLLSRIGSLKPEDIEALYSAAPSLQDVLAGDPPDERSDWEVMYEHTLTAVSHSNRWDAFMKALAEVWMEMGAQFDALVVREVIQKAPETRTWQYLEDLVRRVVLAEVARDLIVEASSAQLPDAHMHSAPYRRLTGPWRWTGLWSGRTEA